MLRMCMFVIEPEQKLGPSFEMRPFGKKKLKTQFNKAEFCSLGLLPPRFPGTPEMEITWVWIANQTMWKTPTMFSQQNCQRSTALALRGSHTGHRAGGTFNYLTESKTKEMVPLSSSFVFLSFFGCHFLLFRQWVWMLVRFVQTE